MKNGWTGGQYSLFRALLGAYLAIRFARLLPWGVELFSNQGLIPSAGMSPLARVFPNILAVFDAPAFVTVLLLSAVVMSLCLAVGKADRAAAVGLWYVSACLYGRNPLISNPSLPFIGWILLAHACLPAAPFGSWRARRRIDPGGGWRFPGAIFAAAWIVMSLGYAYGGLTKLVSPSWTNGTAIQRVLSNPLARPTLLREALLGLPSWVLAAGTWAALALELGFAPLVLSRRLRPVVWLLMLAMHIGLIILIDFAELSLGMILLHLFTFDPAWVRGFRSGATDTVFYDGRCGLCHTWVRLILAEDRAEVPSFQFAPLHSTTFDSSIPPDQRDGLPDSVVVRTADGQIKCRSTAVLYILARLGGLWRVLAWLIVPLPRGLRNCAYDGVAKIRHRLVTRPSDLCPVMPPALRQRFLP